MTNPLAIIVIAAGKGTRMKSALPKVLHPLASRPLIGHVLTTAQSLSPQILVAVTAPDMNDVNEVARQYVPAIGIAKQVKQLGTGDAVKAAYPYLTSFQGTTLVLYGDTPLISTETLTRVLDATQTYDIVVLGMRPSDPGAYGRLKQNSDGELEAIVEFKDATDAEKAIPLCNSGVMAIRGGRIAELVEKITNTNAKGEYYLTDIVKIGRDQGLKCGIVEAETEELLGINTREELYHSEQYLQNKLRTKAMLNGVTLLDASTVYFSADTKLGSDVTIQPHVFFGPGVIVGDNVTIRAFSHLEGCTIAKGSRIGPYARIRPGSKLGEDVHIGNFVEVKKSEVGKGAKINHLSYIGDSFVGEEANIGAGTITCNYDGFYKYETHIGKKAFIGSHTALIAPVVVGEGAIVGAGSIISHDVAPDALALTRSEQIAKPSWATAFRARMGRKEK